MKRFFAITLLVALVAFVTSCQRREFSEKVTPINLQLKIKTDIENSGAVEIPDMVRVDLFNTATGELEYTDYVPPQGGYIYPGPGTYDLLLYNIGTESTIIKNEDNISTVEAYTNEISAYVKSQIKGFLESRVQFRKDKAAQNSQNNGSGSKTPETKDPVLDGTERIVNEPDYLYVGIEEQFEVPALDIDEERDIVCVVDAHSVVETWKIIVKPVEGLQWVSKVSALITGQVESTFIGKDQDSEGVATIYFEMNKNEEEKCLVGTFNTFGKNPLYSSILSLDINIVDNLGNGHNYHFDITKDFFENNEFVIEVVDQPIVIEEPKVEGGGFSVSVNDWVEIETNITL